MISMNWASNVWHEGCNTRGYKSRTKLLVNLQFLALQRYRTLSLYPTNLMRAVLSAQFFPKMKRSSEVEINVRKGILPEVPC
jgi:hypothetical protein